MSTKNIRPNVVFDLIDSGSDEFITAKIVIPNRYTYRGSPMALEKLLLFSLMTYTKPKKIFEFGTYMGTTTRLFCDNTPPDTEIWTIDICNDFETVQNVSHISTDVLELIEKSKSHSGIFIQDQPNINKLKSDSTKYNFSALSGFDFIWIDGGHDLDVVKSDTENAFKILSKSNPHAIIAWHDYRSNLYKELTMYIDDLSKRHSIYWIEETMICFSCPNLDPYLKHTIA